jgi:hypothetical protein
MLESRALALFTKSDQKERPDLAINDLFVKIVIARRYFPALLILSR